MDAMTFTFGQNKRLLQKVLLCGLPFVAAIAYVQHLGVVETVFLVGLVAVVALFPQTFGLMSKSLLQSYTVTITDEALEVITKDNKHMRFPRSQFVAVRVAWYYSDASPSWFGDSTPKQGWNVNHSIFISLEGAGRDPVVFIDYPKKIGWNQNMEPLYNQFAEELAKQLGLEVIPAMTKQRNTTVTGHDQTPQ